MKHTKKFLSLLLALTLLAGSIENGDFTGAYFQLTHSLVLLHDLPWRIQWQSEGSFKDAANGTLLLASASCGNQLQHPAEAAGGIDAELRRCRAALLRSQHGRPCQCLPDR